MARRKPYGSEENRGLLARNELRCSQCRETKSVDCFFKDKNSLSGLRSTCKVCDSIRQKNTRKNRGELKKVIDINMKIQCRTCRESLSIGEFYKDKGTPLGIKYICKPCARGAYKIKGDAGKWRKIQKRYKITKNQFLLMVAAQESKCSICRDFSNKLVLDHNHNNGKLRGLLCNNCNSALGFLKDNITICKNAIDYLEARGSYGKT